MEKELSFLIVDDQDDIREILKERVAAEYPLATIEEAEDGSIAIKKIDAGYLPDIILTDLRMTPMNGVALMKKVREILPSSIVVMMTSFADELYRIENVEFGLDFQIDKPINYPKLFELLTIALIKQTNMPTDFMHVNVEKLLRKDRLPFDIYLRLSLRKVVHFFRAGDEPSRERINELAKKEGVQFLMKKEDFLRIEDSLYTPVRASTFAVDDQITFNVYYEESKDKYKLLISSGTHYLAEHKELLKKNNFKRLHIRDNDELLYQGYLDRVIAPRMKSKEIVEEDKAAMLSTQAAFNVRNVYVQPVKSNYDKLEEVTSTITKYIEDNKALGVRLMLASKEKRDIYQHSVNVATLSLGIVNEIDSLKNDRENQKLFMPLKDLASLSIEARKLISTAALVHDIGSVNMKLSKDGKETNHAEYGANLLESLGGIDSKVIEIVLQHEEYCDGTGKPKGLFKQDISIYAQIISLANFFDKVITLQNQPPKEGLKQITLNSSKFNKNLIPILERVVLSK